MGIGETAYDLDAVFKALDFNKSGTIQFTGNLIACELFASELLKFQAL